MKSDNAENNSHGPRDSSFFTAKGLLAGARVFYRRGPDYCISLLDLTTLGQWLENRAPGEAPRPTDYLSATELGLFASFSHKKRQKQWLGGRLVLKHSIFGLSAAAPEPEPRDFTELSIVAGESGRPEVVPTPRAKTPTPLAVSLSHSEHWAAGIAARAGCCGIDIQKITARILNVTERFAGPAELSLLKSEPNGFAEIERLVMLWSAKEAVKKSLLHDQPTLFAGIELRDIRRDEFHRLDFATRAGLQPRAEVTVLRLDDFMLAFTLDRNPSVNGPKPGRG